MGKSLRLSNVFRIKNKMFRRTGKFAMSQKLLVFEAMKKKYAACHTSDRRILTGKHI